MPSNPFKRLGSLKASSFSSSSSSHGITIAADPNASGSNQSSIAKAAPSTSLALPPDSEYRTSLIMPHLTRRFTLLRAPDGTMVTPDAMRAHLRAQRARARAAGVSGNQTFLTEAEENEIIDQLRRQTRMEIREEDEYEGSRNVDGFGEGSDGFGGTDGFGGWGSSDGYASSQNTGSRIDSRLAESFNSLKDFNGASNVPDVTSGSFFSGRSSARDQAYMSEVEKGRAARGREELNGYNAQKDGRELEQVEEEEDDEVDSEEAMPGDFNVATKRASKQTSDDAKPEQKEARGLQVPQSGQYRQSQLLTSLSPEAFNRVSTALEEVYGMVAGKLPEESEDGDKQIVNDSNSIQRPSIESDSHSFASAQSEVLTGASQSNPALQSPPPSEGIPTGISAATMATTASTSTITPAYAGKDSVEGQTMPGSSSVTSRDIGSSEVFVNQPGNSWTSEEIGPSTFSNSSTAGYTSPSPRIKQGVVSVDAANGRLKRGPVSPDATTFNLGEPSTSTVNPLRVSSSVDSPLHAIFNSMGGQGNGSAAATAAGVAAAAYVANHQRQQRSSKDQQSLAATSPQMSPAPVTNQIVRGIASDIGVRPQQVTRNQSAATNAVLSADAIAARSPRYFPSTPGQSMHKYADGFRQPATPNSSSSSSGHAWDAFQTPNSATMPSVVPAPVIPKLSSPTANTDDSEGRNQQLPLQQSPQQPLQQPLEQTMKSKPTALDPSEGEEDEEGDEIADEDVWAKVARNTAAQTKTTSKTTESLNPTPQLNDPDISLDRLHEIQNSLVRSASSKKAQLGESDDLQRSFDSSMDSMPPPLPISTDSTWIRGHKKSLSSSGSGTSSSLSQAKVEKARERARMIAERQIQQQQSQQEQRSSDQPSIPVESLASKDEVSTPPTTEEVQDVARTPFPTVAEASPIISNTSPRPPPASATRVVSPRSTRSQVMYDVTTSHRPTSPPPRSHKASLTNLPSLQDLSMGVTAVTFGGGGGESTRNSASLASMVEATSHAHDALSSGVVAAPFPLLRAPQPIPEETNDQRSSMIEWEEVAVEDGFGGYVKEKRPVKRNQSQDVPSTMDREVESNNYVDYVNARLSTPLSPMSAHSDPMGSQRSSPPWSRLPGGQEAMYKDNLVDDVAAQAQAATMALKGSQPSRPLAPTRTKSLSRGSRKNLSKAISQPQLLSTTQRLEHAEEVPRVDRTLSKRDGKTQQSQKKSIANTRQASASSGRINTPTPSLTLNAMRTPSSALSSPTDYRGDTMGSAKPTGAGHHRRSSSFGHRGQFENEIGTMTTPIASASLAHSVNTGSPQSDRSPGSLSRFMSRIRSKRQGNGSGLVEPFTSSNSAAMKSSPALSGYGTPSTSGSGLSPVFVTPAEDVSKMPTSAKAGGISPRRLDIPDSGATSLAGLFGPDTLPPRSSSVRTISQGQQQQPQLNASSLGSPAMIQDAWSTNKQGPNVRESIASSTGQNDVGMIGRPGQTKSARDTIVRRTIIVSTIDSDERHKSNVPTRKPSLRKPVPTDDTSSKMSVGGLRRGSSMTSNGQRTSTLEKTGGVSSKGESNVHRRNLSGEMRSEQPMPASSLAPPSPNSQSVKRVSNATSDYGAASLYDMYFDRDESSDAGQTNRGLHPGSSSIRQSMAEGGTNGGSRHIEVTERADGSVVWQVIAGLADRSSSYSNSMLGFGHSRATSNDSQFSYLNQSDTLTSPLSSNRGYSASESLANEDGRSLFARTRGKTRQSFSLDEDVVPPLPSTRGLGEAGFSNKTAAPLEFDMATPAGTAATRIVYTSDAELANMLDSLAGPDKSSAKFEFQRLANADGTTRPLSIWTDNGGSRNSKQAESTDSVHGENKERIRIEAEIYSLLQRDGHPHQVAASAAKQHADLINQSTSPPTRSSTLVNM